MKKANQSKSAASTKFSLLRWLNDEQVSVELSSTIRAGQKCYVGAIGEFKWQGRYYEAEVLKMSDDRQRLSKLCDQLCAHEVSREDILAQSERSVDSTTPERNATKAPVKALSKKARISAAKKRAKDILGLPGYKYDSTDESDAEGEVDRLRKQVLMLEKQLKKKNDMSVNIKNSNFKGIVQTHGPQVLGGRELAKDKEFQKSPAHDSTVSFGFEDPGDDVEHFVDFDGDFENDLAGATCKKTDKGFPGSTPVRRTEMIQGASTSSASTSSASTPAASTPPASVSPLVKGATDSAKKTSFKGVTDCTKHSALPKQIEVVEGYGVICTKPQLDEAVSSASTPTKLARNLLSIFYSPEELAVRSACGKRGKYKAIDGNILLTIISCVQQNYKATAKTLTVIIDAINDKCANYRRRK